MFDDVVLPVHPLTGVRAIGMCRRGPIWPVLGASEDPPAPPPPNDPPADDPPTPPDKGFPADTPVESMTDAQKAAYWQHYARKHENAVKGFKGLTPKQVADLQTEVQSLRNEKLSADERAVAEAKLEAEAAGRAAAESELRPKVQQLQVRAAASQILKGEQLDAYMAQCNTAAMLGDDGEVDESKVMGNLTALFGQQQQNNSNQQFGSGVPRHQDWGQGGRRPPGPTGAQMGLAEAEKRFGKRKSD